MIESDVSAPDRPAILLVSERRGDFLRDEFDRYARDYHLRTARTCSEAVTVLCELREQGRPIALFVTEARLPDAEVLDAFTAWRQVVPTARRMIARTTSTSWTTPWACGRAWPPAPTTLSC